MNEYDSAAAYYRRKRAQFLARPSVMLGLTPRPDGDQWCVLYGENLQDGVAGFGPTPDDAMEAFDREWESGRCGGGRKVARAPDEDMKCPNCERIDWSFPYDRGPIRYPGQHLEYIPIPNFMFCNGCGHRVPIRSGAVPEKAAGGAGGAGEEQDR